MKDFKVLKIIDANTIRVSPCWEVELKDNVIIRGDTINVRGLEGLDNSQLYKDRLEKILLTSNQEISFNSPELISYEDHNNAVVSCSVFIGRTNIAYYFPELVSRQ